MDERENADAGARTGEGAGESMREGASVKPSANADASVKASANESANDSANHGSANASAGMSEEASATASAKAREVLSALDAFERRRYALASAQAVLEFSELTDPPAAQAGRGVAMAELEAADHELLCGGEAEALLQSLRDVAPELDEDHAARLRVLSRDREDRMRIPAALEAKRVELVNRSSALWKEARDADDWGVFAPAMEELVALYKEIAEAAAPEMRPYDFWLDQFEPGSSEASFDALFGEVTPYVEKIARRVHEALAAGSWVEPRALKGPFDPALQHVLFKDAAVLEGIDLERLELGDTIHPFTSAVDSHHVMIANHADPEDVLSGLLAAFHEGGHALYESSVEGRYDYTCLAHGTSTGIHEASSRFFENYVARSASFAPVLRSLIASRFPEAVDGVRLHDLWRLVNEVHFSTSRMEADELTYPLHIVIRYEVERALMAGELSVDDVPARWAELYERYLGVAPKGDLEGALQDVHWSMGLLGYFPSYALGGVIGAQFLHAMREDGVPFDETLAAGDLSPVRRWMVEHVWRFGRAKDTADILLDATKEPLNPVYYLSYLEEKFDPSSALFER